MITARGLTYTYTAKGRSVEAVRGVDLDVADGELVGFLGPNGAGKTTTLRMLTTLLTPSSGEAAIGGCDLLADPAGVRRLIGFVPQSGSTWADSTVAEEIAFQGRAHGLSKKEAKARGKALTRELELADLDGRLTKTLSGGQRRRLDIALGLVHRPTLVFLDEPTTGLDPQSRANLWDHVRRLRAEQGVTVFLTTHYLDEADVLCDRILVIDQGRIVAQGTPDSLKSAVSGDVITVSVPAQSATETAEVAQRVLGVSDVSLREETVHLRVAKGDAALPDLLRALDARGIRMQSMRVHRPTLDDVFLHLTGRSLRDGEAGAPTQEVSAGAP